VEQSSWGLSDPDGVKGNKVKKIRTGSHGEIQHMASATLA